MVLVNEIPFPFMLRKGTIDVVCGNQVDAVKEHSIPGDWMSTGA